MQNTGFSEHWNMPVMEKWLLVDSLPLKILLQRQTKYWTVEKAEQEKVKELEQLGFSIFSRDYKSDLYKMQNTSEFFLGEDGCLYLIYAYGNNNYTSEMDIVVF